MVGRFEHDDAGARPGRHARHGGGRRGSAPSRSRWRRDQRGPDRARLPADGRVRGGSVHRRRAGSGLGAGARADLARRPARPDRASLQERVGDGYALDLGPTYVMHDSWGVGLGFRGLTLRDAAGRTVLSAPARQGRPRPVRARALRGEGPAARARRARPAPARRRRRRAVDRGRQRFRRDADRPAGRGSRGSRALRPRRPRSAPPPKRWPAPPRRSTG